MHLKSGMFIILNLLLLAAASARADEVDDFVRAEMEKRHIPGLSLAVVREGKVVKAQGYGFANVELKVPATPETVYQIASVSKQFIAAGILILAQDGKVNLDDALSKYLEGTPDTWKEITLRQLLTHTSGMMRDDPLPQQAAPSEGEMLRAVAREKLDAAPGERFAYSNVGYNLLSMVIAKVSGKPWEEFLNERIFEPLGMSATRRLVFAPIVPDRAAGYVWAGGSLQNAQGPRRNLAAGASSTVVDMARWDAALYTDAPLTAASRVQMWTPGQLKDGKPAAPRGYGFGWAISEVRGHKLVAHGGLRPGFNANLGRFVDDKLTVIILMNLSGAEPASLVPGVAGFYIPELKGPAE